MHILLTGASGRIGARLAHALQEAGHHVRGYDLRPAPQLDDMVVGDLADPAALDRAMQGIEVVLHLAALMSWHPGDAERLFTINVGGTFNVLWAAERHPVSRFIFASSGEVYPELNPVYQPIDEEHPTQPTSVYGLTKLLGEEMVKHFGRRTGLPFCILRFGHCQAPEELLDPNSFFSGPRFYLNAKRRQLRGFPPNPAIEKTIAALDAVAKPEEQHYIGCTPDGTPYRMGITDVRDMVQGVRLAVEHPAAPGETFNIGPGSSFDFDEAVPYLAQVTGLPVVRVSLFTASYRYDTSIEKAQRLLGYTPQHTIFSMIDDAARLARH